MAALICVLVSEAIEAGWWVLLLVMLATLFVASIVLLCMMRLSTVRAFDFKHGVFGRAGKMGTVREVVKLERVMAIQLLREGSASYSWCWIRDLPPWSHLLACVVTMKAPDAVSGGHDRSQRNE